MRDISSSTLAKLSTVQGLEPIILLDIHWNNNQHTLYGDRTFENIEGRILELGSFNDTVNIEGSGNSGSISVVLDDNDAALKNIFDNIDIHKRPVNVLQWFVGAPLSDAFIIFEGVITSPIIWDEGKRTLSFDIVSKIEDYEAGFAPEDGTFTSLPIDLIGKPWPIGIGDVQLYQPIKITEPTSIFLLKGFGIPDIGIQDQIWRLNQQLSEVDGDQADEINAQIQVLQATFDDQCKWIPYSQSNVDDNYVTLYNSGNIAIAAGRYDVKIEETVFSVEITYGERPTLETPLIECSLRMTIAGANTWKNFAIPDSVQYKDGHFSDFSTNAQSRFGFRFFNPGTQLTFLGPQPITYILNLLQVQNVQVFAYRSFNGIRTLSVVPTSLYSIRSLGSIGAGLDLITITLNRPLPIISYLADQKIHSAEQLIQYKNNVNGIDTPSHIVSKNEWEDDIFVSFYSGVSLANSNNPADVILWILEIFTNAAVDITSFGETRAYTAAYPANFVLLEKRNAIELAQDIAKQARCALWSSNGVFYLRYLGVEPTSVDTITESDIVKETLQLTTTETEQIKTKITATYKQTMRSDEKENRVVVYFNMKSYGSMGEVQNYFIYNNHYAVKKSATFWLIRKANTWRKVTFSTLLHKLRLETMDCIHLDLPHLGIDCKGVIETANYDSNENLIKMTVWLPIRAGEKEPYEFAWLIPTNVPTILTFPPVRDISSGAAGQFVEFKGADLTHEISGPAEITQYEYEEDNGTFNKNNKGGFRRYVNTPLRPDAWGVKEPLDSNDNLIKSDYTTNNPQLSPDRPPNWDYRLHDYPPSGGGGKGSIMPGKVIDGAGSSYTMVVYPNGLGGDSENVTATQLQIDPSEKIPLDSWTLVSKIIGSDGQASYYMQFPVWLTDGGNE